MGGRVWVESEPGQGSTFHITAWFGVQATAAPPHPATRPARLHGLPVLVVDDNATNRRILVELLRNWGMRPTAAGDGRTALTAMWQASAQGEPFPLVLLDALMPQIDGFALAEQIAKHPDLAGSTIMMLSSSGQHRDAARCRELGVAAYLTKPVEPAELLEMIITLLGGRPATGPSPAVAPPPEAPPGRRQLHILLAEDNPVNQALVVHLLERRGHAVSVIGDGREVLAALDREPIDLVLMDVQMPGWNGFEATAAIRTREKGTDRHIPIVAMTAHAMKGDRERCLDAGMDRYLSKPIRPRELLETIAELTRGEPEAANGTDTDGATPPRALGREPAPLPPVAVPVLDLNQALARVDGDWPLLRELAGLFLEGCPDLMATIHDAVSRADAEALERAAHALKGSVSPFGAEAALAAAQRLEVMARQRDLTGVAAAQEALDAAIARLQPELAALGEEPTPAL
jgi:two-component system sensor histidine kinase/response regulator